MFWGDRDEVETVAACAEENHSKCAELELQQKHDGKEKGTSGKTVKKKEPR